MAIPLKLALEKLAKLRVGFDIPAYESTLN